MAICQNKREYQNKAKPMDEGMGWCVKLKAHIKRERFINVTNKTKPTNFGMIIPTHHGTLRKWRIIAQVFKIICDLSKEYYHLQIWNDSRSGNNNYPSKWRYFFMGEGEGSILCDWIKYVEPYKKNWAMVEKAILQNFVKIHTIV